MTLSAQATDIQPASSNVELLLSFSNCSGTHAWSPESSDLWFEEKVDLQLTKKRYLDFCQRKRWGWRDAGVKTKKQAYVCFDRSMFVLSVRSGTREWTCLPSGLSSLCVREGGVDDDYHERSCPRHWLHTCVYFSLDHIPYFPGQMHICWTPPDRLTGVM